MQINKLSDNYLVQQFYYSTKRDVWGYLIINGKKILVGMNEKGKIFEGVA